MKDNNAYEAIGKYIIGFQKIPMIIQHSIQIIFNKYGLERNFGDKDKENIVARIVLSERSVDHLLQIYLSLIEQLFGENSDDFTAVKKVIIFIKTEIVPHRNNLVHSFLFVNANSIDDIHMCREKFMGNTGFGFVQNLPKNRIETQINIMDDIGKLLHYIDKNIEENGKIIGNLIYGDIQFDISKKGVEEYISLLKNKIEKHPL